MLWVRIRLGYNMFQPFITSLHGPHTLASQRLLVNGIRTFPSKIPEQNLEGVEVPKLNHAKTNSPRINFLKNIRGHDLNSTPTSCTFLEDFSREPYIFAGVWSPHPLKNSAQTVLQRSSSSSPFPVQPLCLQSVIPGQELSGAFKNCFLFQCSN